MPNKLEKWYVDDTGLLWNYMDIHRAYPNKYTDLEAQKLLDQMAFDYGWSEFEDE